MCLIGFLNDCHLIQTDGMNLSDVNIVCVLCCGTCLQCPHDYHEGKLTLPLMRHAFVSTKDGGVVLYCTFQ